MICVLRIERSFDELIFHICMVVLLVACQFLISDLDVSLDHRVKFLRFLTQNLADVEFVSACDYRWARTYRTPV
jgi:hypothetical protein